MPHFNFTDRVRLGLQYAREEAAKLRHDYVGSEHILLGLMRVGGRGMTALEALPVSLPELRTSLLEVMTPGRSVATHAELPYTSRAKKTLELAMIEARELGDPYIGTEHLLLGLLREEIGIAAQTLGAAGVTPAILRAEVLRRRGAPDDAFVGDTPASPPAAIAVTVVLEHPDGRVVAAKFADTASAINYLTAKSTDR